MAVAVCLNVTNADVRIMMHEIVQNENNNTKERNHTKITWRMHFNKGCVKLKTKVSNFKHMECVHFREIFY